MGRKGGLASGAAKRRRRGLKVTFENLLQLPWFKLKDAPINEVLSFSEMLNKAQNMTVEDKIAVAMIAAAIQGNVRAAEYIRDTIGFKVINKNVEKQYRLTTPTDTGNDFYTSVVTFLN